MSTCGSPSYDDEVETVLAHAVDGQHGMCEGHCQHHEEAQHGGSEEALAAQDVEELSAASHPAIVSNPFRSNLREINGRGGGMDVSPSDR